MKHLLAATLALTFLTSPVVFAESKIDFAGADTPQTLLPKLVGQKVELHMRSGEKLAGKVESATPNGVHLSNLAGQEFFDAVVNVTDISAVVLRVR